MQRERGAGIAVPLCLFVSGAAGLAYEVVWARHLALFIGSTAVAHSVVLATFMGGLAFGGFAFGRTADRVRRPLRLYGLLELAIAALCVIFPLLMSLAGKGYLLTARPLSDSSGVLLVLRALLAAAVVAPPAILMGGTLPAAARFYVHALPDVGSGVGRLYFVNSAGAVLGTILAGFVLVPSLGLDRTLGIAALGNLFAGVVALVVSSRIERLDRGVPLTPSEERQARPSNSPENLSAERSRIAVATSSSVSSTSETTEPERPFGPVVARFALWATAISGAAAMAYEIVWLRILTLVLGGSTYAFATMLAAFILGIALGSALVGVKRLGLGRDPLRWFARFEILVAVAALVLVPLHNKLPYFYLQVTSIFARTPDNYPWFLAAGFGVCVLAMLIPTTLLGATFPLAAQVATRSMAALGGGVGRTYAFNTVGSLLGIVLAAHLLLPKVGLYATLVIAASANLVAGLLCLLGVWAEEGADEKRMIGRAFTLGTVAAFVPLWLWVSPGIDRATFTAGVFRHLEYRFDSAETLASWARSGTTWVFDRDGADATITVFDYEGFRSMNVNGKTDASSGPDMATQLFVGHLPALFHPEPKRSLLVGLGSGATASALLAHPDNHLTTLEISSEIVEAAALFEDAHRGALHHPRMELVVDDARAWLALTDERFDVIVSEPSNPWVAGNASLFTHEFLELVKSHLEPGGVFLQWFQGYEITNEAVEIILRTTASSFPHVDLFHGGQGHDFLLVCRMDDVELDEARLREALATNEVVREDLARLGIRTPLGLYARHVLDTSSLRAAGGTGPLHHDLRPRLDFMAPVGVFLGREPEVLTRIDGRRTLLDPSRGDDATGGELLLRKWIEAGGVLDDVAFTEIVENLSPPFHRLRLGAVRAWAEQSGSVESRRALATELHRHRRFDASLAVDRAMAESGEANDADAVRRWSAEVLRHVEQGAPFQPGAVDHALTRLVVAVDRVNTPEAHVELARTAEAAERWHIAARGWSRAAELTPAELPHEKVRRLVRFAENARWAGDDEAARGALDQALGMDPSDWRAKLDRGQLGEGEGSASAAIP